MSTPHGKLLFSAQERSRHNPEQLEIYDDGLRLRHTTDPAAVEGLWSEVFDISYSIRKRELFWAGIGDGGILGVILSVVIGLLIGSLNAFAEEDLKNDPQAPYAADKLFVELQAEGKDTEIVFDRSFEDYDTGRNYLLRAWTQATGGVPTRRAWQ